MSKQATMASLQAINQRNQRASGLDSTWDYAKQTAMRAQVSLTEQIAVIVEARAFLQGANRYSGEAAVLISSVSRDLEIASHEWAENNSRCMKETGPATTSSEHALILDICSTFIQIVERLLSAHSLTVGRISEIITEVYAEANRVSQVGVTPQTVDNVEIKEVF